MTGEMTEELILSGADIVKVGEWLSFSIPLTCLGIGPGWICLNEL